MFVFVFEDVLIDYSAGMAVIVANDLQRAQKMAYEKFGVRESYEQFMASEDGAGFAKPTAEFRTDDFEEEQIKYVYGGG